MFSDFIKNVKNVVWKVIKVGNIYVIYYFMIVLVGCVKKLKLFLL